MFTTLLPELRPYLERLLNDALAETEMTIRQHATREHMLCLLQKELVHFIFMQLMGALPLGARSQFTSLLEQGVAVALLAAPFFLVIHTLLTLWPLIRGHAKGLAAVWGAGAAGLGLVSLTDDGAGPEMTSLVLLCRLLVLLGPGLLSLVTVAWMVDRWRRGPA